MLHLVAFSPSREDLLRQLALACDAGDTLVLLEDGVFFCQGSDLQRLTDTLPRVTLQVLEADLHVGLQGLCGDIATTDFDGLAALTEAHEKIVSWYP